MAVQVFGPGTISDLLHLEIRDEGSLSLASAPVHVLTQNSCDDTRYALVVDADLNRRALMDLLFAVAPYKAHGPDRFSRVLDNWALLERAKTSSASESLTLQHAARLKFSWHEFVRHRHVFVDVLQDAAGEQQVTPLLTWSRGADGKRRWEFAIQDTGFLRTIEDNRPEVTGRRLDTLVGLVTIPYFVPELRKRWHAWQPLARGEKSNYIGPASVPVLVLTHRRALLNSTLCQCVEEYITERTR